MIFTAIFMILLDFGYAVDKNLCGLDERVDSHYSAVMRLRPTLAPNAITSCTAFLISDRCAVTAGHCIDALEFAEFNVPDGIGETFSEVASSPEDTYEIDKASINSSNNGTGADFTVFKLRPNLITGLYPGVVQGRLEIDYVEPLKGDAISIIGYGVSFRNKESYLSQKISMGEVLSTNYRRALPFITNLHSVTYNAGSTGGDSGAPVILNRSGKVIGIHNVGGCFPGNQKRNNSATLFKSQERLKAAINHCLAN